MKSDRTVVFIGPERTDARSVKRMAALTDLGWQVTGFTFHRDRGQADPPPSWENIHLGTTYNRRYFQRVWAIMRACGILFRHHRCLRDAAAIYVINPDNALLALFGRLVCRRRFPLMVEIADIQPAMSGTGIVSRALRFLERFVLRRSQLLVTTSPGFLRHYFEPVQKYRGPVFLLENKVYPSAALIAARTNRTLPVRDGKWTLGYFGVFRCQRSVDLICRLAAAFPDKLRFMLRGVPAGIDGNLFRKKIAEHSNIEFGGPYRYPDDLPAMYGGVDFNWCFDFSSAGAGSTWLLPNRIYEGGLFHCPALAFAETESGMWLNTKRLGTVFTEDLYEQLREYFCTLTLQQWTGMAIRCAAASDALFAGENDYQELSTQIERLAEK